MIELLTVQDIALLNMSLKKDVVRVEHHDSSMRAGKESRAPQSCEERQYGLVNPPIAVD